MDNPKRTNLKSFVVGVLIAASVFSVALVIATAGWLPLLAIPALLALVALAGAASKALRRATKKHAQIVDEEIDQPRAALDDPDPFNTRLRIQPVTHPDDTEPGETR